MKKYGLEKIKTIGDTYMVAGGIPKAMDDHCEAVAMCAIDMQKVMNAGINDHLKNFKIRVGMHTPVVAGVIGNEMLNIFDFINKLLVFISDKFDLACFYFFIWKLERWLTKID